MGDIFLYIFFLGKVGLFPFWFWVFRLFFDTSVFCSFLFVGIYKLVPFMLFIWLCDLFVLNEFFFLNVLSVILIYFFLFDFSGFVSCLSIFSACWLLLGFFFSSFFGLVFFLFYLLFLFCLLFLKFRVTEGSIMIFGVIMLYIGLPGFFSFFLKFFVVLCRLDFFVFVVLLLFSFLLMFVLIVFFVSHRSSFFFVFFLSLSLILFSF